MMFSYIAGFSIVLLGATGLVWCVRQRVVETKEREKAERIERWRRDCQAVFGFVPDLNSREDQIRIRFCYLRLRLREVRSVADGTSIEERASIHQAFLFVRGMLHRPEARHFVLRNLAQYDEVVAQQLRLEAVEIIASQ